jgi:pimeloyl-ACP methyl ester carboxylesterase
MLAFPAVGKDVIDETVAEYFRPFQNDVAALAPDGRHLAMGDNVRGQPAGIVIVNLDDRTSRRYPLASDASVDHSVQQLLWVSPTRLVFTTRSRCIGAIEPGRGEVKALLVGRDLDAYRPQPVLGLRRTESIVTPDMPADPRENAPLGGMMERREVSLKEALTQAHVTGDLFGSDSKRDAGVALRPFLLGVKPGAGAAVLVELRSDGDLMAYSRLQRTKLTVPGNVVVQDGPAGFVPPTEPPPNQGLLGYAAYDVDFPQAPLVVLELDSAKGRTKEIATEETWRRVLLDQQGRLRLALEQRGKRFRYLYRGADAKKWVPLDSIVKTREPLGFDVGPENLLATRSVPLGFDANGHVLFIASNIGRETFKLRALDLDTGQLMDEFVVGHDHFDLIEPTALTVGEVLRFDPHTQKLVGMRFAAARRDTTWFNADFAAMQAGLNKKFAPQQCDIRGWDAERTRFLVELSSPGDPGGFAVFDPGAGKFVRFGDRAPWLTEARLNYTHVFDFATEDGRRLAGSLTMPRNPRLNPPPVLVYFHDGPWFSDPPVFNRGAQALAALGFAVLQLNHRGSSGYGRAHLTAIDGGLDRVVLDDVRAMLARVSSGKLALNTRMAAALGNGVGGYLAVRMAQLAPETFRCAVAINAPGDLEAWRTQLDSTPTMWTDVRRHYFGADRELLRAHSAVAAGAATKAPVLVVHATENSYVPITMGRELYRALKKGSDETAFLELAGEGHGGWSEKATAKLFAELGRFFNATIYNYGVNVRAPEVVK